MIPDFHVLLGHLLVLPQEQKHLPLQIASGLGAGDDAPHVRFRAGRIPGQGPQHREGPGSVRARAQRVQVLAHQKEQDVDEHRSVFEQRHDLLLGDGDAARVPLLLAAVEHGQQHRRLRAVGIHPAVAAQDGIQIACELDEDLGVEGALELAQNVQDAAIAHVGAVQQVRHAAPVVLADELRRYRLPGRVREKPPCRRRKFLLDHRGDARRVLPEELAEAVARMVDAGRRLRRSGPARGCCVRGFFLFRCAHRILPAGKAALYAECGRKASGQTAYPSPESAPEGGCAWWGDSHGVPSGLHAWASSEMASVVTSSADARSSLIFGAFLFHAVRCEPTSR